jgi:hypothetical protein
MGNKSSKESDNPDLPYVKSGRKCTVADKAYLEFRIAQLNYCSYIMEVLRAASIRGSLSTDVVAQVIDSIKTYKPVDGVTANYELDILSSDPSFKGPADKANVFSVMVNYLQQPSLKSTDQVKADLDEWHEMVGRIKNFIGQQIVQACR